MEDIALDAGWRPVSEFTDADGCACVEYVSEDGTASVLLSVGTDGERAMLVLRPEELKRKAESLCELIARLTDTDEFEEPEMVLHALLSMESTQRVTITREMLSSVRVPQWLPEAAARRALESMVGQVLERDEAELMHVDHDEQTVTAVLCGERQHPFRVTWKWDGASLRVLLCEPERIDYD